MNIRVFNIQGDQIELSPQVKSALESLGLDAEKSDVNWEEVTQKIVRVLEDDGFEAAKLQSEISYSDTQKGKIIQEIKFNYWGK